MLFSQRRIDGLLYRQWDTEPEKTTCCCRLMEYDHSGQHFIFHSPSFVTWKLHNACNWHANNWMSQVHPGMLVYNLVNTALDTWRRLCCLALCAEYFCYSMQMTRSAQILAELALQDRLLNARRARPCILQGQFSSRLDRETCWMVIYIRRTDNMSQWRACYMMASVAV